MTTDPPTTDRNRLFIERWRPLLGDLAKGPEDYDPHDIEQLCKQLERVVAERDKANDRIERLKADLDEVGALAATLERERDEARSGHTDLRVRVDSLAVNYSAIAKGLHRDGARGGGMAAGARQQARAHDEVALNLRGLLKAAGADE